MRPAAWPSGDSVENLKRHKRSPTSWRRRLLLLQFKPGVTHEARSTSSTSYVLRLEVVYPGFACMLFIISTVNAHRSTIINPANARRRMRQRTQQMVRVAEMQRPASSGAPDVQSLRERRDGLAISPRPWARLPESPSGCSGLHGSWPMLPASDRRNDAAMLRLSPTRTTTQMKRNLLVRGCRHS